MALVRVMTYLRAIRMYPKFVKSAATAEQDSFNNKMWIDTYGGVLEKGQHDIYTELVAQKKAIVLLQNRVEELENNDE